jgi:DNA-binding LacI/PurR family transcriptional regulator
MGADKLPAISPISVRPGRASQKDVAREAGVSQATVSRVFTHEETVSEEKRAAVLAAAEQLGYRPDAIARSLVQDATRMIGLAIMRFTNPFYARMIRDFTRALQELGYWTLLLNVANREEMEKTLPTALQYQVDGMIVTSATLSSRMADEFARAGTPVVLFNRYANGDRVNAVCCDNVEGARMVADRLLDGGHARIAYITGEIGSSTNRDRQEGFTDRLRERGYELVLRETGDYYYESGWLAARRLLQTDDPPDAIFCANDLMAMGALDVARAELGIKVPDELSIVGFDDIPMAAWPAYSLTTIRQPIKPMVDASIEVLMDAIENSNAERVIRWIPPVFVERTSARTARVQTVPAEEG